MLALDVRLSSMIRIAERPGPLRTIAGVLAHSGNSWFWWAGLALLSLLGNTFWRMWGVTVLVSIVILAIIVLGIKFTIRRRRPEGEWGAIYRNTDPHSFPSGHAARAILIAILAISAQIPASNNILHTVSVRVADRNSLIIILLPDKIIGEVSVRPEYARKLIREQQSKTVSD